MIGPNTEGRDHIPKHVVWLGRDGHQLTLQFDGICVKKYIELCPVNPRGRSILSISIELVHHHQAGEANITWVIAVPMVKS